MMPSFTVVKGDVRTLLADMDDKSVRCCITSPPYWGLRDYGTGSWAGGSIECDHSAISQPRSSRPSSGLTGGKTTVDAGSVMKGNCYKCGAVRIDAQMGLESTPDAYVTNLVNLFREVRRVLTNDGTLWLNLGDSYAAQRGGTDGLKHKDLVGIPWRVALALQADGWYLRSDIIWHKPNPMPESVTDRPTKAHEYLFLLAKSAKYYYDHKAVAEAANPANHRNSPGVRRTAPGTQDHAGFKDGRHFKTRNRRSVWTITPKPFKGAHFAVMPEALVEPCILAGSTEGDLVLDPFAGSGTVGVVALRHGRDFIGFDLNKDYVEMAKARIRASQKGE